MVAEVTALEDFMSTRIDADFVEKERSVRPHANEYTTISLFSGAMGLDLGLESAGIRAGFCQDIDKWAVKTIQNNKSDVPIILGDIREIPTRAILEEAGLGKREAFMVSGGPPCQSFSTAGNRRSIGDPRGSLFKEFSRVVDDVRPRFFVMENVKGLVSAAIKHRPLSERVKRDLTPEEELGSAFKVILEEFHRLKYKVVYGVLDAVYYGVPQFRERLIVLGSRDHEDIFLPVPTHFQKHQETDYHWRTLRDAIEKYEDGPGVHSEFSAERKKILEMVPEGGNWKDLPEDLIPTAMGGAYKSKGGKMGFYRRLSYDQPSPTIVTSPTHKGTMLCHPKFTRPLSVKEYAAIQQFPEDWEVNGNVAESYKQIGNAVPVGLGRAIGEALIATVTGTQKVKVKRRRGTGVHKDILGLF